MASYQANRDGGEAAAQSYSDQKKAEDKRSDENNAKNIQNAADVAIASKNPYAAAAGAAVKAGDKLTGGRLSKGLGKAMTRANKMNPAGKRIQDASNKLSESGASDKIGKAASMSSGMGGGANATAGAEVAGAQNNMDKAGRGQESSLPSSSETEGGVLTKGKDSGGSKPESNDKDSSSSNDSGGDLNLTKGILKVLMKNPVAIALVIGLPTLLFLSVIVIAAATIIDQDSEYEDALAISTATGGPTGYTEYNSTDDDFREYIQRVIGVTGDDGTSDSYESYNDSPYLIVVGTVHVIMARDVTYTYKYFTNGKIRKIARAIDGDEQATKTNLANNIFPKYFEGLSQGEYETLADSVFEYIKNYYSYIGQDRNSTDCIATSTSTCSYGVKGYYINGKGNVKETQNLSNVKVRIMDCNDRSKSVPGEDLVDFEKYILGVAYAENEGAKEEAFKAQLIAARSFILARHTDIGGKIKTEGDNSIIETVSCNKDQVYCDPDRGCSKKDGNMRSGTDYTLYKKAIPDDSKYRSWAKEVEGKVLLNNQSYIVYTGYTSKEQKKFDSLAAEGKDYKQILLEVYSGSKASDISQSSCTTSEACSTVGTAASGDYTTWKQGNEIWGSIPLGSSSTDIANSGCTVTSIAMQIKRSGVDTSKVEGNFNPGTFVQALNKIGGFSANGGIIWGKVTELIPDFKYVTTVDVKGKTQEEKLNKIKELVGKGYYIVAEVKGATPNSQHWVAIDQVKGNTITMMDPGSSATNMWQKYDPVKTTFLSCYKAN